MPTQPLGWFKNPVTKTADLKGVKFRTVGIFIDVFTGLGAGVNRERLDEGERSCCAKR